MIKSIKVTNYLGESLTMDLWRPELSGFAVLNIEGLEPPKADVNITEVATNDGGVYNSARLTTRNIVLEFIFIDGHNGETIEDIRHKSYKYFPIKKEVTLTIETENRTSEVHGYVESNAAIVFDKKVGTQISILCSDPYLYSADRPNITVFSGIEPMFEFPFCNDSIDEPLLEMGSIQNKTEQVITYTGDAEIGVAITIYAIGEASDIAIYNVNTREVMKLDTTKLAALTGSGIIAGDEITINTNSNRKSISLLRDGKKHNILNCLSRDADWFRLVKGDNIFAYTAETGSSNLQFRIENRVIYEGV